MVRPAGWRPSSAGTQEAPPRLFNLTDLQRAANARYGLTATQTLAAAQTLYEAGLLTYPRTDSRHVTPEVAGTFPARLRAAGGLPAPWAPSPSDWPALRPTPASA